MSDGDKGAPPWMKPEEGDEVGQKIAEEMAAEGDAEPETTDDQVAGDDGAGAAGGTGDMPDLSETVVELEEELQQAKERLLRVAADYENFRKRAQREQEEARFRGREEVLKELISVFDNLERAVEAAATHEATEASTAILEGVAMVQRQFSDGLSRYGLKQFTAKGKPFDPNFHEAMAQVASEEYPPGVVVQEYQKGYLLGDRLLRAAMVVVASPASTGTASADSAAEATEGTADEAKTIEMDASEVPPAQASEEGSD